MTNSAPANQTYTIAFVADHEDVSAPGYDLMSVPVLNAALSDASCSYSVGAESVLAPE